MKAAFVEHVLRPRNTHLQNEGRGDESVASRHTARWEQLSCFRGEFYSCLTARVDEHRRGHGGLYSAVARGRGDVGRLRRVLASVSLPRAVDGRLVLAVDITCWLRPDAHTSPQRTLCHTYGRGKDQHIPVPGRPYSVICALELGRSSWTAPLDALRLAPGDDTTTVIARQLRELAKTLIKAGQWLVTENPDHRGRWL